MSGRETSEEMSEEGAKHGARKIGPAKISLISLSEIAAKCNASPVDEREKERARERERESIASRRPALFSDARIDNVETSRLFLCTLFQIDPGIPFSFLPRVRRSSSPPSLSLSLSLFSSTPERSFSRHVPPTNLVSTD